MHYGTLVTLHCPGLQVSFGSVIDMANMVEQRCATRFPVKLPISVRGIADLLAQSKDMSAAGISIKVDSEMPVGSRIEFTVSLPADGVGAKTDVQVNCVGRVIRCTSGEDGHSVAAIIDEYSFVHP
jgi:hypothetical protein